MRVAVGEGWKRESEDRATIFLAGPISGMVTHGKRRSVFVLDVERFLAGRILSATTTQLRIPPVVSDYQNAYGIAEDAEEKVMRKTLQVDASDVTLSIEKDSGRLAASCVK